MEKSGFADFRGPSRIATDGVVPNRIPLWFLLLGMGLPLLVTWIYFDALSQSPRAIQQTAYLVGKGTQLLLPFVAWWCWRGAWNRGRPSTEQSEFGPNWLGLLATVIGAIGVGIAIAGLMFLVYFVWLEPQGVMANAKSAGEARLRALGIDSVWLLVALALFYSLIHSGFEEFYWRRFVFGGLTTHWKWMTAIIGSSLAFMAHHVLVLSHFFGWGSPWTYLFSLGVAVGGGLWAVMFWRSGSWISAWISHGIVDAAIFLIALRLIHGTGFPL